MALVTWDNDDISWAANVGSAEGSKDFSDKSIRGAKDW